MKEWFFFVVGAVAGSVANAVIDRLPRGETWWRGRSKCDRCGHTLGWRDLVPVVSYLKLGGKCRYCHSPISRRNLFVEIFLGFGFVVISYLLSAVSLVLMAILWVTVVVAVMDWETMLVSEAMVALWAILVVGHQLSVGQLSLGSSLLGLTVGLAVIGGIWALSRGKAMGFGDVEISLVSGWWLGWPKIGVALWVAFVVGAGVGVVLVTRGKKKLRSQMPFGPFILLGSWVGYLWGDMIKTWLFPF